jgi:hypothetical protein
MSNRSLNIFTQDSDAFVNTFAKVEKVFKNYNVIMNGPVFNGTQTVTVENIDLDTYLRKINNFKKETNIKNFGYTGL